MLFYYTFVKAAKIDNRGHFDHYLKVKLKLENSSSKVVLS